MYLLQTNNDPSRAIFAIFTIVLRIIGAMYCSSKAKELNRNKGRWGFFGFVMPVIAMIWISFRKSHISWEKEPIYQKEETSTSNDKNPLIYLTEIDQKKKPNNLPSEEIDFAMGTNGIMKIVIVCLLGVVFLIVFSNFYK